MKKIKVTEKSGASIEYINDGEVLERLSQMGHGLPERWVLHKDEPMAESYDDADVIDERIVEDEPAVEPVLISEGIQAKPAVYDNENLISEATEEVLAVYSEGVPAKTHKEVKLKAEYSVEIVDISAQVALENCMAARKAEYPTAEEFLNAFFDGGEAGLEALRAKRLAIKQKHPKP